VAVVAFGLGALSAIVFGYISVLAILVVGIAHRSGISWTWIALVTGLLHIGLAVVCVFLPPRAKVIQIIGDNNRNITQRAAERPLKYRVKRKERRNDHRDSNVSVRAGDYNRWRVARRHRPGERAARYLWNPVFAHQRGVDEWVLYRGGDSGFGEGGAGEEVMKQTTNAQRPTPNVEMQRLSSRLGVRR
jgi:hypothetical protein